MSFTASFLGALRVLVVNIAVLDNPSPVILISGTRPNGCPHFGTQVRSRHSRAPLSLLVREGDMRRIILPLTLTFLVLATSAFSDNDELKEVSFLPQWIPQAQFAGYMMALEKGLYERAGLDVDLLEGGPGKNPMAYLLNREATFGTSWLATGIEERALGLPVVCIGQILQRTALMLVADRTRGVTKLQDLAGKKVALWVGPFGLQPTLYLNGKGIHVQNLANYSSIELFLRHGVIATWAMWYNEYHLILNSGFNPDELTVFDLKDSAFDFPEDGLYCLEETYRKDPGMCAAFAAASIKGWLYAFKHKEETLDVVMRYAEAAYTGTNRAHQRWMLSRMEDLILPGGRKQTAGKLDLKDYVAVGEALQENRIINEIPPLREFYKGPE